MLRLLTPSFPGSRAFASVLHTKCAEQKVPKWPKNHRETHVPARADGMERTSDLNVRESEGRAKLLSLPPASLSKAEGN